MQPCYARLRFGYKLLGLTTSGLGRLKPLYLAFFSAAQSLEMSEKTLPSGYNYTFIAASLQYYLMHETDQGETDQIEPAYSYICI